MRDFKCEVRFLIIVYDSRCPGRTSKRSKFLVRPQIGPFCQIRIVSDGMNYNTSIEISSGIINERLESVALRYYQDLHKGNLLSFALYLQLAPFTRFNLLALI